MTEIPKAKGRLDNRMRAIGTAALFVMTLLAYAPAMSAGFIWDDDDYITQNLTLRSLDGLRRIWFEPGAVPQYYPLVHTTFWLEHHIWDDNPAGYHIVNIILHAVSAILLCIVLRRLDFSWPLAWVAAAVFALHPVHVESVAWITERKNVLSSTFYFLSLLAYLRFAPPDEDNSLLERRWRFYCLSALLFLAALLSKTVACSLPAAILLLVWWKRGRLRRTDVAATLPMFIMGIAFGMFTAMMERNHVGAQGADWDFSLIDRCLIAGRNVWFYAGKIIWPVKLAFIYPRWEIDAHQWWQCFYPISAVALVIVLWVLRRRIGRGPLVAVLFFGGTLFPALGFINVYPFRFSFVADHFQHLASIGLTTLAVVLGGAAIATLGSRRRVIATAVASILLIAMGFLTWRQTLVYQDAQRVWEDTLIKNPDAFIAHQNLGNILLTQWKREPVNQKLRSQAIEHFQSALRIKPDFAPALNIIGVELARDGHDADAIEYFRRALDSNPQYVRALRGDPTALIDRDFVDALYNLGTAHGRLGQYDQAIQYLSMAVALSKPTPEFVHTRIDLAIALKRQHRIEEARAVLQKALEIDPANERARLNLQHLSDDHPP